MARTPYLYALDLLSARPYTVKNLKKKMLDRDFDPDDADSAIQRLLDAGLLDDAKYAALYARSKLTSSGSSKRRIRMELARKGVPSDVASEAIDTVVEEEQIDTAQIVDKVARKKLALLGDLEPVVLRRRLYGFLARRGYDIDEINAVVGRLVRA